MQAHVTAGFVVGLILAASALLPDSCGHKAMLRSPLQEVSNRARSEKW